MFYDFPECVCAYASVVLPPSAYLVGVTSRLSLMLFVFMPFCILYIYICAKFMCAIVFMACTHFAPKCHIYIRILLVLEEGRMLSLFERHFNADSGLGAKWNGTGIGFGRGSGSGALCGGWVAVLALFCKLWHMRRRRALCLILLPLIWHTKYVDTHAYVCPYVNPYVPELCHLSCLCGKYIK